MNSMIVRTSTQFILFIIALMLLGFITANKSYAAFDFEQQANYWYGFAPLAISPEDFDRDGDIDIAIGGFELSDMQKGRIIVLINDGTGTYQAKPIITSDYRIRTITSGDFDDDGDVDIAAGSTNHVTLVTDSISGDISFFSNDGYGNFQLDSVVNIGIGIEERQANEISAFDFDNDRDIDIALAGSYGLSSGHVSVLLNDGSGGFVLTSSTNVDQSPRTILAADFNGDNNSDLATINLEDQSLSILLNDMSGTLTVTSTFTNVGIAPTDMIANDLDNDGDVDLAITDQNTHTVVILHNSGLGAFTTDAVVSTGTYVNGGNPSSLTSTDLDNDGDIDLAVANYDPKRIAIIRNDNGVFSFDSDWEVSGNPFVISTSDINGDGYYDLFTGTESGSAVLLQILVSGNNAPIFSNIGNLVVDEGQTLEFTISATDPDGDNLTYAALNTPEGSSFDTEIGTFTWTPNTNQSGEYTITFTATDDGTPAASTTIDVVITVVDSNSMPTEQIENLITIIADLELPAQITNSYLTNLNNAENFIEEDKIIRAINQMIVFTAKVRVHFLLGIITQEERDSLIESAETIIEELRNN